MDQVLKQRLLKLCADIGSPFASATASRLERNDWVGLASSGVEPQDYPETHFGAEQYHADAGLAALFSKNAALETGIDRKAASLSKWWDSERLCCHTNARFAQYLRGYYPGVDGRVVQFMHAVQRRIARILGPLPREIRGRLGPGSTFEAPDATFAQKSLTAADKVSVTAGTAAAIELTSYPCLQDRFTAPWLFEGDRLIRQVRGSRWSCAPKNALTDRSIALEPGLNVYYQLGIEERLWARLGDLGIYKATAQEVHRRLASLALQLGLATLDESMASDLWARNAVRFLLARAPLWLELLESTRCPVMRVGNQSVYLEKFSSMGNGWTFPLQTILFYALVREVVGEEGTVAVFGDDIICPVDRAEDVIAVLRWFGHKPNLAKSHYRGVFRESCGEDYFAGVPVRPHFLKTWPTDVPDWYRLANGLRRRYRSRAFLAFAAWCVRQIPVGFRFGGPDSMNPREGYDPLSGTWYQDKGDVVLLGHRSVRRTRNWCHQIRGIKYVGREVDECHFSWQDVLTVTLMGSSLVYRRSPKNGRPVSYLPTRGVSGWKTAWLTCFVG